MVSSPSMMFLEKPFSMPAQHGIILRSRDEAINDLENDEREPVLANDWWLRTDTKSGDLNKRNHALRFATFYSKQEPLRPSRRSCNTWSTLYIVSNTRCHQAKVAAWVWAEAGSG